MSIRASKTDVMTKVKRRLYAEARKAAGSNHLVSRAEQASLPAGVLTRAANELRGGPGTRVDVEALVSESTQAIENLLGQVNQRSGPGAATISAREVSAVFALSADGGKRIARAYELITGKRITAPSTEAPPSASALTPARKALIEARARDVAMSGDMMNGEVPAGPYWEKLDVLRVDPMGIGRNSTVFIPLEENGDPNGVEVLWLLSKDRDEVTRTATFAVPLDASTPEVPEGRDVVGNLRGAVDGLSRWHESGDNGVDTRVVHLEGAQSLDEALDALKTQVSQSAATLRPGDGSEAVDSFRAAAAYDLEDWRATFYDEEPPPQADENTDAMAAFDAAVTAAFTPLSEIREARGEAGERYLLGRVKDGYVAVVIWPYRDG